MKSLEDLKELLDGYIQTREYHVDRFRTTLCRESMDYHKGCIDVLDIKIKLLRDVMYGS
jgi:hypothetical protein